MAEIRPSEASPVSAISSAHPTGMNRAVHSATFRVLWLMESCTAVPPPSIADESALEIYVPNTPMKSFVCWGLIRLTAARPEAEELWLNYVPAESNRCPSILALHRMRRRPMFGCRFVRGTDVALMLTWINYIIEHKLYDQDFVMHWTNLPYLVNTKTKMFLRPNEIVEGGNPKDYVVWDTKTGSPKVMPYPWDDNLSPALEGTFEYKGQQYKTGFTLLKEQAAPTQLRRQPKFAGLFRKRS